MSDNRILRVITNIQNEIINFYWSLRRSYWRIKLQIRNVSYFLNQKYQAARLQLERFNGTLRSLLIYIYWKFYGFFTSIYWKFHGFFPSVYWKTIEPLRVFIIRLIWKFKSSIGYIKGAGINFYWTFRRSYNSISATVVHGYWAVKNSVLFYPFRKTYWFFYYQIQTRVKPFFNKKV